MCGKQGHWGHGGKRSQRAWPVLGAAEGVEGKREETLVSTEGKAFVTLTSQVLTYEWWRRSQTEADRERIKSREVEPVSVTWRGTEVVLAREATLGRGQREARGGMDPGAC